MRPYWGRATCSHPPTQSSTHRCPNPNRFRPRLTSAVRAWPFAKFRCVSFRRQRNHRSSSDPQKPDPCRAFSFLPTTTFGILEWKCLWFCRPPQPPLSARAYRHYRCAQLLSSAHSAPCAGNLPPSHRESTRDIGRLKTNPSVSAHRRTVSKCPGPSKILRRRSRYSLDGPSDCRPACSCRIRLAPSRREPHPDLLSDSHRGEFP